MVKNLLIYLITLAIFSVGNSFAQDVKGKNYEIVYIKDSCHSKVFYNKNYNKYPNPFAPSPDDLNIGFRLTDFSKVKVEILLVNGEFSYNVVEIDTVLSKGCYSVE